MVPVGVDGQVAAMPTVTDLDGARVPDGTWRQFACDPVVRPVVVDGAGAPLDVGRAHRLITDDIRAAMVARDGGCVMARCDAHVDWVEGHHRIHWVDGGPTSLDNTDSLCRRHHRVLHRPGWTLSRTPDGWPVFETPTGERFWGQRHRRTRAGQPPPLDPVAEVRHQETP